MRISFESPKGGQGLTSTVCGIAYAMAATKDVSLVDGPDVRAVLGLGSHTEPPVNVEVADNLLLVPSVSEARSTLTLGENLGDADRWYLVIQPCYLALRRAMEDADNLSDDYDGVITFRAKGRVLNHLDVSDILGLPIVGVIDWDEGVARLIDAGILIRRPWHQVDKIAQRILEASDVE